MPNKYKLLIFIFLPVLILDQFTKYYISVTMELSQTIEVIKGYFNVTYVRNPGAAFGILNDKDSLWVTIFFISVSIIAIIVIMTMYVKSLDDERFIHLSLSLIISGAFGNLVDRILYHEVIDFLDVHWRAYHWPVFNVADSAITVGMIVLSYCIIKEGMSHADASVK